MQAFVDVIRYQVLVLFCEPCDVVDDLASVMFNLELRCLKLARFLVVRVLGLLEVELMELAEKVLIVSTNRALLIDELEERGLRQGL